MVYTYKLPVPEGEQKKLAAGWLLLSIASLVFSGLLSILLVLSRTPYIQDYFPWLNFFHKALVVHVDLSVVIWFLSFAGVFWSLTSSEKFLKIGHIALLFSFAGTLIIAASPFLGAENPLMNNYVPVLEDPLFFTGLFLFTGGFVLLLLRTLITPLFILPAEAESRAMRFAVYSAAIAALVSLIAFGWSYKSIPDVYSGELYYELLFWGGGHILQFVHTMLMLVSWLWLAGLTGIRLKAPPTIVNLAFSIILVVVLLTPFIYINHDITSYEHQQAFTDLMKFGPGFSVTVFTILITAGFFLRGRSNEERGMYDASLITSIMLFAAGGIIGFLIEGIDVTIPAHYHGSIVGVTLAFIGITYYLLPHLSFRKPSQKLALIQPYIYGGGQLLNIIGLAWAGGYGVERKTPGPEQGLDTIKEIAGMGLMGIGGLIAVAGGFLFLVITIRAMWPGRRLTIDD